ncbi:hypothetical protein AYI69_g10613, partial [Smittium culicis]|jgi:hypothetical protein
MRKH